MLHTVENLHQMWTQHMDELRNIILHPILIKVIEDLLE
jgi:hypothetical protein